MTRNKHTKSWFLHRIGKYIMRDGSFADPIKIASKMHAIAIYITQKEKNYTYTELS